MKIKILLYIGFVFMVSCKSKQYHAIDFNPIIYDYLNTHSNYIISTLRDQTFSNTITKEYINIHIFEDQTFSKSKY